MKYKIIAVDLDGTLLDNNHNISDFTTDALLKAQNMGTKIIISSGRPTFGVTPFVDKLRLKEYNGFTISYNGGVITECSTGNVLFSKCIDNESFLTTHSLAKENGLSMICYHKDMIISDSPLNKYIMYSAERNKMKFQFVNNLVDYVDFPLPKCMIIGHPDAVISLQNKIDSEYVDKSFDVYRSEPFFLEVVPKGIDKAVALDCILSYCNLTKEDLIAFGDSYNDIPMIRFAGLGVAMGNACNEVKDVADFVTVDNDSDGVAMAIMKFVI